MFFNPVSEWVFRPSDTFVGDGRRRTREAEVEFACKEFWDLSGGLEGILILGNFEFGMEVVVIKRDSDARIGGSTEDEKPRYTAKSSGFIHGFKSRSASGRGGIFATKTKPPEKPKEEIVTWLPIPCGEDQKKFADALDSKTYYLFRTDNGALICGFRGMLRQDVRKITHYATVTGPGG